MNHTERVYEVARQVRGLTRELAREAIERYLDSVAEEAAQGMWVTLPALGRLQIVRRQSGGQLLAHIGNGQHRFRRPGYRLQVCFRMTDTFKDRCHDALNRGTADYPGSTRSQPGEASDYPGSTRNLPGKHSEEGVQK